MTDWSKYYIDETEETPTGDVAVAEEVVQPDQAQPVEQPVESEGVEDEAFNWNKYMVQEEPSTLQEAGRHAARAGSRVGEAILGFPGDFVQFAKGVGEWLDSKLPEGPKWLQREPNFVQKFGQRMLEKLPTSSELKDTMSDWTDGYVDPQSATEEFGDDIIQLASYMLGDKKSAVTKTGKIAKTVTSALGKAFAAKSAAKGLEAYGVGEGGQLLGEMGTLVLMSMINKKAASQMVSDKFTKARGLIPEGTMVATDGLASELEALEKSLSRGVSTGSKNEVKQAVAELRAKASGGAMEMDEVVEALHDMNERMSSKKLFDELSRTEQKKLRYRYNQAKEVIGKEIKKYGESNPEFFKEWAEGMEGFAAIENSKKATKFIERYTGKLPAKVAQGMAVELLLGAPQAAGATGTAFAGLKGYELFNRMASSPVLRKHYIEVFTQAAAENGPAMVKAIGNLDKELRKSMEEEAKDIIKKD